MNPDPGAPAQRGPTTKAGRSSPHLLPLAIAALAFAAMLGGVEALFWLRYERDGILSGEVWRVITAHLTHMGWPHLAVNLGGLLLIWLIFGSMLPTRLWLIVFLASALGVSAGLLIFHPELRWYVGLSGVLHGMFVAGALAGIFSGFRAEWFLLAALVAKLAWEQLQGPLPGTEAFVGGLVVVDAHLFGAVAGMVTLLVSRALAYRA